MTTRQISETIEDIYCFEVRKAVTVAFPEMEQQRCIVHMVRNTLKYAANKDVKKFAKDPKTIYTTPNEETACKQLENVTEKWEKKYPNVMKNKKSHRKLTVIQLGIKPILLQQFFVISLL